MSLLIFSASHFLFQLTTKECFSKLPTLLNTISIYLLYMLLCSENDLEITDVYTHYCINLNDSSAADFSRVFRRLKSMQSSKQKIVQQLFKIYN